MHTRAAVAVFDAEASNKIVTGKVTSDRSMTVSFPLPYIGRCYRMLREFARGGDLDLMAAQADPELSSAPRASSPAP